MAKYCNILLLSITVTTSWVAAMLKLPKTIKPPHSQALVGLSRYKKDIHISAYKGTQELFKEDCHDFSPLGGPPLKESGWLEKCSTLFPDTATAQLIAAPSQGLFYKLNSQFRPTHNKSLPAYSLSPELIGELVGHMITGDIFNLESVVMKKYIHTWRDYHKNITGSAVGLEKTKQFLALIQNALQEADMQKEDALFLPYTPHKILWALVYTKFKHKQDLATALGSLHTVTDCLVDSSSVASLKYLTTAYSEEDLENTQNGSLREHMRNYNFKKFHHECQQNYEKVICAIIAKPCNKILLPDLVTQGHYGYKDQPAVADCVEASLLEAFVNMILYNPETKKYDLSLVSDKINPHKEFLEFLEKVTQKNLNDQPIRTTWMEVLSGHHFIEYDRSDNYEMLPTLDNVLNIVNHLYGIHAKNFKELSELVSSPKQKVTIELDTFDGQKIKNTEKIIFTLSGVKNTVYRLNMTHQHAYVLRDVNPFNGQIEAFAQNSFIHMKNEDMLKSHMMLPLCLKEFFVTPEKSHLSLDFLKIAHMPYENSQDRLKLLEKLEKLGARNSVIPKLISHIKQKI